MQWAGGGVADVQVAVRDVNGSKVLTRSVPWNSTEALDEAYRRVEAEDSARSRRAHTLLPLLMAVVSSAAVARVALGTAPSQRLRETASSAHEASTAL